MAEGGLYNLCDWCLQDDNSISAAQYCFECSDKLCTDCVSIHGKCLPLITHRLVNIDEQNFNDRAIELVRDLQTCPNHPLKIVEYICKDHDEVFCTECAIVKHRKCDQLVPLSEECGNRTAEPDDLTLSSVTQLEEQVDTMLLHEKNNQAVIEESGEHVKQTLDKRTEGLRECDVQSSPVFSFDLSSDSDDESKEEDFDQPWAVEHEINENNSNFDFRSCVWLGQYVILTNCMGEELVQLDTNQWKIARIYKTLNHPWCIFGMGGVRVALCFNTKFIQVCSMHNNIHVLYHRDFIKTEDRIVAAAFDRNENQLICLSVAAGSVCILSLDGQTIRSVHMDTILSDNLRTALNIAYDNNTHTIYVTCYTNNKIISFNKNGQKLEEIESEDQSPWGIVVDDDSNIYIVNGNGSVDQYDSDLKYVKEIVQENSEILDAWSMAFNEDTTKFVLSGFEFIEVFQFGVTMTMNRQKILFMVT